MMYITLDYIHSEGWRLEVEWWNEDEMLAVQQLPSQF